MAVVNNLFSKATYVTLGSIQPMQPSVIIEMSCSAVGDFYEKHLRFGLVLGQLAMLKKHWADYEQLLRVVFSCCQEQKKFVCFFKYCSVHTK